MKETQHTTPTRRRWLGAIAAALGLAGLGACSERSDRPPAIPYGQALDVTRVSEVIGPPAPQIVPKKLVALAC